MGAAGARTRISLGHHLLHPLILRLLLLCAPAVWDPELSRMHLHPQIQAPNAFPEIWWKKSFRRPYFKQLSQMVSDMLRTSCISEIWIKTSYYYLCICMLSYTYSTFALYTHLLYRVHLFQLNLKPCMLKFGIVCGKKWKFFFWLFYSIDWGKI